MIKHPFKLEYLVATTFFVVAVIFVTVSLLENSILADASLETLKYVYILRGASAACSVLLLAILFIRLDRRHTRLLVRKLSQAVEQSPSSVLITDQTGRIEYVNPRFTKMTGYRGEEVIGKSPSILKSGQTPPAVYKKFWETIASGKDWKGEFLNKKKTGEFYWESILVSPLMDPPGKISHYIGVLEDVSDRRKLEDLKNTLLGTVSHEMKTPLAVIKWSVRNLEDGLTGPVSKKQREIIHVINRSLTRLEKIIHEVLDLSRLESDKTPLDRTRFDLSVLIHESLISYRERLKSGDLVIEEQMENPLYVEADSDKIFQVVSNLVENALRFATQTITVKARDDGESILVSVIDDGPGIEPEDQKRLFNKFERLSGSGKREQYRGTGLGLAICKEIILQHEGKIWVEGCPSQGARFHFRIPQKQKQQGQEMPLLKREEERFYGTV